MLRAAAAILAFLLGGAYETADRTGETTGTGDPNRAHADSRPAAVLGSRKPHDALAVRRAEGLPQRRRVGSPGYGQQDDREGEIAVRRFSPWTTSPPE